MASNRLDVLPGAEPETELRASDFTDHPDPLVRMTSRLVFATTGLLVLLSLYTFYFAAPVLIPLAIAILLSMLLSPIMKRLDRLHVPRPLGAALTVVTLIAVLAGITFVLSGPAQGWINRVQASSGEIQQKLRYLKQPFAQISRATEQIDKATDFQGSQTLPKVQIARPGLSERILGGSAQAVASVSVIVVLLFFLLSAGDSFLRKLVSIVPTLHDKKRAVEMIRSIEDGISFYLGLITSINVGLGVGVGVITWALGIPDPLLWGVLAMLLSFAPYIGEIAIAVILFVASLLHFDTFIQALAAPAAYVFMISIMHLAVPLIIRRRLLLNPVMVFVSIIFFGWMWGVVGALVAVPLLASFKVICERVDGLNPVAAFLTP